MSNHKCSGFVIFTEDIMNDFVILFSVYFSVREKRGIQVLFKISLTSAIGFLLSFFPFLPEVLCFFVPNRRSLFSYRISRFRMRRVPRSTPCFLFVALQDFLSYQGVHLQLKGDRLDWVQLQM